MRAGMLLLALAATMGGCSNLTTYRARPAAAVSMPGPCGALARQRLDDAVMAGEAEGYERAILNKSYQDCLAAAQKFGNP
jgi:hypothetical protein